MAPDQVSHLDALIGSDSFPPVYRYRFTAQVASFPDPDPLDAAGNQIGGETDGPGVEGEGEATEGEGEGGGEGKGEGWRRRAAPVARASPERATRSTDAGAAGCVAPDQVSHLDALICGLIVLLNMMPG